MNRDAQYDRFEELEAGRLLGDLDEQEWSEWRELSKSHAGQRDDSLERVIIAMEDAFSSPGKGSLPKHLADRLRTDAQAFQPVAPEPRPSAPDNIVEGNFPPVLRSPRAAWGVAAALAALLVAVTFIRPAGDPDRETEPVALAPLEERAGDLVAPAFSGVEEYAGMSGRVVWSDELQEGYMELSNLGVNDPSQNQYQLWIVDPGRSEQPVDGGVFDIRSDGTVRVPIDAKLAVNRPQAFVITLEKPGGVVVSSQETVVAISKVGA